MLVQAKDILTSQPSPAPDVIPSDQGDLPGAIIALAHQAHDAVAAAADANDKLQQLTETTKAQYDEVQKQIAGKVAAIDDLGKQLAQVRADLQKSDLDKETKIKAMQDENSQHQAEWEAKEKQLLAAADEQNKVITQKNHEIDNLKSKLSSFRAPWSRPSSAGPTARFSPCLPTTPSTSISARAIISGRG